MSVFPERLVGWEIRRKKVLNYSEKQSKTNPLSKKRKSDIYSSLGIITRGLILPQVQLLHKEVQVWHKIPWVEKAVVSSFRV